jgi:hypothetical protein
VNAVPHALTQQPSRKEAWTRVDAGPGRFV